MIPYSRQSISDEDIAAVVKVLKSSFLTQGPEILAFEAALSNICDVPHVTAVSSGTAALHIACQAMGLGPGDLLWTSPITFVASANCARYCGADVDFVDIDPVTYNMSIPALERKLEAAASINRLPKIVVPVHLSGLPCDMCEIMALSERFGFFVLEDASHALGATYQSQPVGDCFHSHVTVFSFHAVKMITTGEGGAALTRDSRLHETMQRLRSHGINKNPETMRLPSPGPWYYEQLELGSHYRLTEMQAALGRSQLERLNLFLHARRNLAAKYDQLLEDIKIRRPFRAPDRESSWHLYIIHLEPEVLSRISQTEIFKGMHQAGWGVQLHYIPVYLHPYYQNLGFRPGDYPEAESYYASAMSLPLHCELSAEDQINVCRDLRHILGE